MELVCITMDCADPARLAAFWSAALGWEVTHVSAGGAYLRPPDAHRPGLELIRVDEPKVTKNRLHLGTNTMGADLDTEIERLLALGATVAWEEEFPDTWTYRNVVLRDPEGNEFCLGNEAPR